MGTDPKPNQVIFCFDAHCSPTEPDADGINWFAMVYLLKVQQRITGVLTLQVKGLSGFALDWHGEIKEGFAKLFGSMGDHNCSSSRRMVFPSLNSVKASSASLAIWFWD
jgi:hypothetical protein